MSILNEHFKPPIELLIQHLETGATSTYKDLIRDYKKGMRKLGSLAVKRELIMKELERISNELNQTKERLYKQYEEQEA